MMQICVLKNTSKQKAEIIVKSKMPQAYPPEEEILRCFGHHAKPKKYPRKRRYCMQSRKSLAIKTTIVIHRFDTLCRNISGNVTRHLSHGLGNAQVLGYEGGANYGQNCSPKAISEGDGRHIDTF